MSSWKSTLRRVWAVMVGTWVLLLSLVLLPELIEVLSESEDGVGIGERVAGLWFVVMGVAVPGWVVFTLLRRAGGAATDEGEE